MSPRRQMLAAGFGGAVGSVADIASLVVMVQVVRLPIPTAAFIASAIGAVVCFVLNKYVAFRDRSPLAIAQVVRFGLVAVATACLMAVMMKLVAVDLGVPYLVAKVVCAAAVFLAWTYPAQRRLVFHRRHAPA